MISMVAAAAAGGVPVAAAAVVEFGEASAVAVGAGDSTRRTGGAERSLLLKGEPFNMLELGLPDLAKCL